MEPHLALSVQNERQLLKLLEQHELGNLSSRLLAGGLTHSALLSMTPSDCERLGIRSAADRSRLLACAAQARALSEQFYSGENDVTNHQASYSQESAAGRNMTGFTESRICVAVRKRPLNKTECQSGHTDVLVVENQNVLQVLEPKVKLDLTPYTHSHSYYFDEIFNENATNIDVYRCTTAALVDTMFSGGCAACFAYGQTGSGKTHTMMGSVGITGRQGELGIYQLAIRDVLKRIAENAKSGRSPFIRLLCNFYEIYGSKLYDLLAGRALIRPLEDKDQKLQLVGITDHMINSERDAASLINQGLEHRHIGTTSANDTSSRSHAILVLQLATSDGRKMPGGGGKFSLIDLAGSERGADTRHCDRQARLEGAEINKSLLALKECIRALDMARSHIPFRGSKLTEVLRDSFIGNSRTVMIGTVSPGTISCEQTLNTLRYADRVKEIRLSEDEGFSVEPLMPIVDNNMFPNIISQKDPAASQHTRQSPVAIRPPFDNYMPLDPSPHETARSSQILGGSLPASSRFRRSPTPPVPQNERKHQALIERILKLEDQCVEKHHKTLESRMNQTGSELQIIQKLNHGNINIEHYVLETERIVAAQIKELRMFGRRLKTLRELLDEEERLFNTLNPQS